MENDPENQPVQTPPKDGWFKKVFYHPNFNVLAGLFGIIGTVFGIYTWLNSKNEPDLTYYISPTRAAIVQKGQLENFSVNFHGLQITNDLSGATIQVYNQGKKTIPGTDIRKPITIRTRDGEPIYQLSVTSSRDVVTYIATTNQNPLSGVVNINWDTLEQDDGFKIQIIYGGDVNLPILVDGVIVGQKMIDHYISNENREESRFHKIVATTTICFYIIAVFALKWTNNVLNKLGFKLDSNVLIVLLFAFSLQFWSWIITVGEQFFQHKPPFGL